MTLWHVSPPERRRQILERGLIADPAARGALVRLQSPDLHVGTSGVFLLACRRTAESVAALLGFDLYEVDDEGLLVEERGPSSVLAEERWTPADVPPERVALVVP